MTPLLPGAQYGRLPFDLFILEKWNFTESTENDQRQWNTLVKEYLSRPLTERKEYHDSARKVKDKSGKYGPLLTPEDIARVLKPHQTSQERNISALVQSDFITPVWVRVCYDSDLEDQYQQFKQGCDNGEAFGVVPEHAEMFLDDAVLYDTGPNYDMEAILQIMVTRIPALFDTDPAEAPSREEGETSLDALELANTTTHTFLLVADAEGIKENLVKIMWLDSYGNCVWNNKAEPEDLEPMNGGFSGGFSLVESIECYALSCNQDGHGARYRGFSEEL